MLPSWTAFLSRSPVDLVCLERSVVSPVWHFAGHLGLKYSLLVRSERSHPTGELASSPQPKRMWCHFFLLLTRLVLLLLLLPLAFLQPAFSTLQNL